VVSAIHVHVVFVTKYRPGVFDAATLTRRQEVIRQVCADAGAELAESNGEHDHVHPLVEYPPKIPVSTLVNSLKGVSSPQTAPGLHRPGEPDVHARPLLVAQLPRRIARRGAAEHQPAIPRAAETTRPRMRLTPP
jgi:REP element-mobilizing transposase RayT